MSFIFLLYLFYYVVLGVSIGLEQTIPGAMAISAIAVCVSHFVAGGVVAFRHPDVINTRYMKAINFEADVLLVTAIVVASVEVHFGEPEYIATILAFIGNTGCLIGRLGNPLVFNS